MSAIYWAAAPVSLLLCALGLAQAAYSIAARAQDEVPPWQMWGPYRPNLYFGVRPQLPETFLMGLMWASGESQDEMLESTYPALLQSSTLSILRPRSICRSPI